MLNGSLSIYLLHGKWRIGVLGPNMLILRQQRPPDDPQYAIPARSLGATSATQQLAPRPFLMFVPLKPHRRSADQTATLNNASTPPSLDRRSAHAGMAGPTASHRSNRTA